jgi:hypothetical protein
MRIFSFSRPLQALAGRHKRIGRMMALGLALIATQSSAMSLRQLGALEKQDKQGANYVRYYLVGVMEGLMGAEKSRVAEGASPRICSVDKRMEPAMAHSLFEAERKRNRDMYEADMPVTLVMRNALENAYPCHE